MSPQTLPRERKLMAKKGSCIHVDKKDNGCKINRGCGWRQEYCCVTYLGEQCDNRTLPSTSIQSLKIVGVYSYVGSGGLGYVLMKYL